MCDGLVLVLLAQLWPGMDGIYISLFALGNGLVWKVFSGHYYGDPCKLLSFAPIIYFYSLVVNL